MVVPAEIPTVSVIIPVYNAVASLQRALDSVLSQTYPGITEVIVADDGSHDDPRRFLCDHFPDVIYMSQSNQGPSAARNLGVRHATGEFIAFLDSDDEWLAEKVSRQVEVFRQQPDLALLLTQCNYVYPNGEHRRPPQHSLPDLYRVQMSDFVSRRFRAEAELRFTPSTWLVKRETYTQLGGLDPDWRVMEDWHFLLRFLQQGFSLGLLTKPLVNYHFSPGSLMKSVDPAVFRSAVDRQMDLLRRLDQVVDGHGPQLTPTETAHLVFVECCWRAWHLFRNGDLREAARLLREAAHSRESWWRRALVYPPWGAVALLAVLTGGRQPLLHVLSSRFRRWRHRTRAGKT